MGSVNEQDFEATTVTGTKKEDIFDKLPSSPVAPPSELPKTPAATEKSKKQVRINAPASPVPGSIKKPVRGAPAWRASYLSKFSHHKSPKKGTAAADNDSDSDLEILPPPTSNAMRKLAELAGVNTLPNGRGSGRPGRSSAKTGNDSDLKLMASIQAKQREQILRNRAEKDAQAKARGEGAADSKTKEEDEEDLKEDLWDQARRSAEMIRKREKELEKEMGKMKDSVGDSEEDEEEAEFKIDVEDAPESENGDSDGDLVVKFHDDEAEADEEGEEEDEDDEEEDEEDVEDLNDEDVPVFENMDQIQVPATLKELKDRGDSENEDADTALTFKSTKRRRGPIANEEEDEDVAAAPTLVINTSTADLPAADSAGLLSMSQLFQDSQAPGGTAPAPQHTEDAASKLRAVANYFPTQDGFESVAIPVLEQPASPQEPTPQAQTQSQTRPIRQGSELDQEFDLLPTQLSQFPAPTPLSPIKRTGLSEIWESSEDEDTQPTEEVAKLERKEDEVQSKPSKAGLRRLMKRPDSETADHVAESTMAATAPVHKPSKSKRTFDTTKARELADEEAVESDDEWAGLGGHSDEEMDTELARELAQMVDDSRQTNEGAADLQKLFAQKQRNQDEELVNKLLTDVAAGGWRKKLGNKGGSLLDGLSDEEDEEEDRRRAEYRRRKARQEARRRGKMLEENDQLSAMARNPRAKAFLEAIADDSSFLDSKNYFADEPSGEEDDEDDDEQDESQSQSPETQPIEGTTATTQVFSAIASVTDDSQASTRTNSMGPPPLVSAVAGTVRKDTGSVDSTKDKASRKKRKLTTEYVRATLSFLDDDDEVKTQQLNAAWQPARNLGVAMDEADLNSASGGSSSQDEHHEDEEMLGEPSAAAFAKPALSMASRTASSSLVSRVVNRRLERRSLVQSRTTSIRTNGIDMVDLGNSDNEGDGGDDDDDDGIMFRGGSLSSMASFTSVRAAFQKSSFSKSSNQETSSSTSFATVTVGGVSTGVSSKAAINYNNNSRNQKRKLGVAPGLKRTGAAQDMANKAKLEAVKRAIKQRQQVSLYSQGSWD